jgi:hypothetical protein
VPGILWQREVDLRVIRYQIETCGSALAIMYEGKIWFHSLKHVPPPGQAIPWYGDVGGAYEFAFRPRDEGYQLRVEMTLAGHEFFCTDTIDPLELTVPGEDQHRTSHHRSTVVGFDRDW